MGSVRLRLLIGLLACFPEDALIQRPANEESGLYQGIKMWPERRQEADPMGCLQYAERTHNRNAQRARQTAGVASVDYQTTGANLQGLADRFALAWTKASDTHAFTDGLRWRTLRQPVIPCN